MIQRKLENPLAEQILGGKLVAGDTVVVNAKGDALVIERRPGAQEQAAE